MKRKKPRAKKWLNRTLAALAVVLIAAAVGLATFGVGNFWRKPVGPEARRIESYTYNPQTEEFSFIVGYGHGDENNFSLERTETFTLKLDPQNPTIRKGKESRGFNPVEVLKVLPLFEGAVTYCIENVLWWESGQGVPLKDGKPAVHPLRLPETRH